MLHIKLHQLLEKILGNLELGGGHFGVIRWLGFMFNISILITSIENDKGQLKVKQRLRETKMPIPLDLFVDAKNLLELFLWLSLLGDESERKSVNVLSMS